LCINPWTRGLPLAAYLNSEGRQTSVRNREQLINSSTTAPHLRLNPTRDFKSVEGEGRHANFSVLNSALKGNKSLEKAQKVIAQV